MKSIKALLLFAIAVYHAALLSSCSSDTRHRTVVCIPVYGQSLALGEEAIRITNFDSLELNYDGRIVTECLDYGFGFIDDNIYKQKLKKLLNYNKRSFELSVYGMAESLARQLGNDTIICIFPGGKGMSSIDTICKPNDIYFKFLKEVKNAYESSKDKEWDFYVPAICWMQGESDIIDFPENDYEQKLKQFQKDVNNDIKAITGQKEDIRMICYQSNLLTQSAHYQPNAYDCKVTKMPQAIVNLLSTDSLFWASGPTYPYTFVNEYLHIDGTSQKRIGNLHAIAALKIIRGEEKVYGLIPRSTSVEGTDILVHFKVPHPPLVFDTVAIKPAKHYGFSIIDKEGKDIVKDVIIEADHVRIKCTSIPNECKIRYAVNGEIKKSGHERGPRGNLRDSQGDSLSVTIERKSYPLYNWCYQFDIPISFTQ